MGNRVQQPVKPKGKTQATFKKVGISFRKEVLQALNDFAKVKYRGNRRKAVVAD